MLRKNLQNKDLKPFYLAAADSSGSFKGFIGAEDIKGLNKVLSSLNLFPLGNIINVRGAVYDEERN